MEVMRLLCGLLVLIFCSQTGYNQSNNEAYKKVFLDSSFFKCDSVDAYYFGYGYFQGRREITYLKSLNYGYNDLWSYSGVPGEKGKPLLLNGTFRTSEYSTNPYEHRETIELDEFRDGYLYKHNRYELLNGDTIENGIALYDSLYQSKPGTHYYYLENSVDTLYGYYRDGKHGWGFYTDYDTRGLIYSNGKYPYWKGYVPAFIGIIGGAEGFRNPGYEAGISFNSQVEGSGNQETELYGATASLLVSFKKRFDNSYYSINSEWGIYAPFTFGLGHAFHTNGLDKKHTFQIITGVTLFHLQLLYSYSFFKNSKNPIADLPHHAFSVRFNLPVWRI